MIIDCHTHLNRYAPGDPPTLDERYAALGERMDAHGVAYAIVISSYDVTPDRPSAEDVLARIEGDPRMGLVLAPTAEEAAAADFARLRELLGTGRVRGLKLYPGYVPIAVHDPRLRGVYELAGEFGVPVMIHTGDTYERRTRVRFAHPLEVDEVAVTFREVRIVLCHMGNPWFLDAAEVLYKNPNAFGDISGLTLGEFQPRYAAFARAKLAEATAFLNDPTRMMFGTDWPISDVGSYLEFARSLEMTPEEMDGLMWRNAATVYGLEGLAAAVDGDAAGGDAAGGDSDDGDAADVDAADGGAADGDSAEGDGADGARA